ncbi:MAG: peptide/nickel transport system substrate-binding protein [Gaiellales bacterium]|jgi:peptide/nickel transport system substrate-binding protein|nr:peptide/nickel transport system substrate-binding protein [Gaiellales bacterium]
MRQGTRFLALAAATALIAAGCGSGSSSGSSAAGVINGGILQAGIPGNPDHLDPALSYTNEGWEILEATNNGLLTFKKAAGGAGATVVPDIASAMPTVTDGGKTYTFHLRSGVMFGNPINREVKPSDFKFSIERLFRVDSGGVGFFTGIAGANSYAKTRKGGISGIVADDKTMTITFHLTQPDGTFNDYIATPFAFVMPVGTPDKDVSTIPQWRVPTGPYEITGYVPHQSVTIRRNPHFHSWTPDTPDGHIDGIDVHIGVTPEESVNEVASGQLDWYFESVPPDRLTALKAQYPKQVFPFTRNNTTFFVMNERKYPFNKLAVRQAVNYAIDRNALVKIYGGQGTPTENIIPPGFGSAFKPIHLYPHDINKAKQLIQQAGVEGAAVTVWGHNTDPTPAAVQYLAGVLNQIGLKATVKTFDESVYWDTIATEKGDPQIMFNDWNEDYPEAQDWIDVMLNGEHIVNVGNNDISNTNIPAYNKLIDQAKAMPLGAARNALWARLDYLFMKNDAAWAPFMNREWPKFVSSRLHGLVFNGTYFELFPSMYLSK